MRCDSCHSLVDPGMHLVPQGSEMKYALKRLITGLGVGQETARPGYSLALAQVRWQLLEGAQPRWSKRWGVRRAGVSAAGGESVVRGRSVMGVASELMGGVPTWRSR